MKRLFTLILALSLCLLCGCGGQGGATEPSTVPVAEVTEAPSEIPTEIPTEVPTEAPTEAPAEVPTEPPVYYNPLTGETLDAPVESRIFAVSINNVAPALPHYGVSKADLYFEMYINDFAVRGLALYADIREAEAVGSVRSLRYNFTDICQAYDAIVVHVGASDPVMRDLWKTDVPNISVESEKADYYFRDQERFESGYAWEHCLFIKGPDIYDYAEEKGIRVTQPRDTAYGLSFTENAVPADGEPASKVTINLIHGSAVKPTVMVYDEETGLYTYNQYNRVSYDGHYETDEQFKNVIVMKCKVNNQMVKSTVYHIAELIGSGEGYFACGGKIIPIRWSRESDGDTFHFSLTDGTPLELGVGSTYIAIAPLTSTVEFE